MFEQILVPVDFSEKNQQALDIALNLAQLSGGSVHLLHVIKLLAGDGYDEFAEFYGKLEVQAGERMDALMGRVRVDGVRIESHLVLGGRAREILFFAEENEVDLIVMNSHKIDPENPDEGWGTISQKVGILAQCPILLVK